MSNEFVITVASKTPGAKGGFDIIDGVGGKYILSAKNATLSEALIVGRASKISVAPTQFGIFINKAELFEGGVKSPDKPLVAPQSIPSPVKEVSGSKPPTDSQEMSKEDWAERERITRISIQRQTSLNAAVEVAKTFNADSVDKVLTIAKRFEAYLEGINIKEVSKSKSKLVEEAKKLGAEEIDPENIPF